MSQASPNPSPSELDEVRIAYQDLHESEKAKIMRFTARQRFTDDLFETWLKESGLEAEVPRDVVAERGRDSVRVQLDATILKEENERLLADTLRKYYTDGERDLLEMLVHWVRAEKEAAGDVAAEEFEQVLATKEVPDELGDHPHYLLLRASLAGGLLDRAMLDLEAQEESEASAPESMDEVEVENVPILFPKAAEQGEKAEEAVAESEVTDQEEVAEVEVEKPEVQEEGPEVAEEVKAGIVAVPLNKKEALFQMEELDSLSAELSQQVEGLHAGKQGIDPENMAKQAIRASALGQSLRSFATPLGTWNTGRELKSLIEEIPDAHVVWAEGLADFLSKLPIQHPLRRKRDAAEQLRQAAVSELMNFATLGGVEEEVPGPEENVVGWWGWATALTDAEFDRLESWCGVNSLDQLADFIAEQWSMAMTMQSSNAVAQALSEAQDAAIAEAKNKNPVPVVLAAASVKADQVVAEEKVLKPVAVEALEEDSVGAKEEPEVDAVIEEVTAVEAVEEVVAEESVSEGTVETPQETKPQEGETEEEARKRGTLHAAMEAARRSLKESDQEG